VLLMNTLPADELADRLEVCVDKFVIDVPMPALPESTRIGAVIFPLAPFVIACALANEKVVVADEDPTIETFLLFRLLSARVTNTVVPFAVKATGSVVLPVRTIVSGANCVPTVAVLFRMIDAATI